MKFVKRMLSVFFYPLAMVVIVAMGLAVVENLHFLKTADSRFSVIEAQVKRLDNQQRFNASQIVGLEERTICLENAVKANHK